MTRLRLLVVVVATIVAMLLGDNPAYAPESHTEYIYREIPLR